MKTAFLAFLLFVSPCCDALELKFPGNKPVACSVTQTWSAAGKVSDKTFMEQCHSQIDFDLKLSKSQAQIEATLSVTRIRFHVKNGAGIDATFDSAHKEKTSPGNLSDISNLQDYLANLVFQIGANGEVTGNLPSDFFPALEKLFEGPKSSIKEILPASKKFWFLRENNFKNILQTILSNKGMDIKMGENYEIAIQPRLSPELFQIEPSNLATIWFANNNYYTQEYLLLIHGISSTDIQGLWTGTSTFTLKDPTGNVKETLSCNGNVNWSRKNALHQIRTWTWAGKMKSDLKKAPAEFDFSFEETIQTQPKP